LRLYFGVVKNGDNYLPNSSKLARIIITLTIKKLANLEMAISGH
jgi:hypothetical protein